MYRILKMLLNYTMPMPKCHGEIDHNSNLQSFLHNTVSQITDVNPNYTYHRFKLRAPLSDRRSPPPDAWKTASGRFRARARRVTTDCGPWPWAVGVARGRGAVAADRSPVALGRRPPAPLPPRMGD